MSIRNSSVIHEGKVTEAKSSRVSNKTQFSFEHKLAKDYGNNKQS